MSGAAGLWLRSRRMRSVLGTQGRTQSVRLHSANAAPFRSGCLRSADSCLIPVPEQARLSGLSGSQACAETGWPFHIGGFSIPARDTRDWSNPFSGRIDEVTLYDRGLREDEVERLFADQMSWVEERQSNNILVDGDVPACEVASPESYLPAEGMQLLAAARDATSGIDSMELAFCKSAGACTPANWTPADACTAGNGAILVGGRTARGPSHDLRGRGAD